MRKGKTWFHRDVVALPTLPPLAFNEGDRAHLAALIKKCYEDTEQARPKLEWYSHKSTNLAEGEDNLPLLPPGAPYVKPAWTFISSPPLSREEKDYVRQLKSLFAAARSWSRNNPATAITCFQVLSSTTRFTPFCRIYAPSCCWTAGAGGPTVTTLSFFLLSFRNKTSTKE